MERFFLSRDSAALVVVDIQDKLAAVMKSREEVVRNCLHLIELAKLLDMPIIITEQYPRGLGPTLHEISAALPNVAPIEKLVFSCCEDSAFELAARGTGRKTVILTGMEAHICVLQTALGLLKEGFHVHVVSDAVCSRSGDNWRAGLEFMRDAGAVITSTETVLFQLLKMAGTDEFKVIAKRIR